MSQQTALRNGINYSWANITLVLFGIPITGIAKIEYAKKKKKDNNYGAGSEPISRGYGNSEYTCVLQFYQDAWREIQALAPNNDPTEIAPFPIQVVFGSTRISTKVDTLQMCEFMDDGMAASQGDTKLMIDVPVIIGGIKHS